MKELMRVVEESIKRRASRVLQLWDQVCSVIYENAIENRVMETENRAVFSFHNSSFKIRELSNGNKVIEIQTSF